jgi:hypothetical protein
MATNKELEEESIFKKIGEYLQNNPENIAECDIPGSAATEVHRHLRDMVRIHVYYAQTAVRHQEIMKNLTEQINVLQKSVSQIKQDLSHLDSILSSRLNEI